MASEPLLTASDVAALLGVSEDWIYSESRAGRIPHVKLGRNVRFRRSSIDTWIAELEGATLPATTSAGARGGWNR